MYEIDKTNLTYDAVHGYIPFTSDVGLKPGEISERTLIDNPWVQRLRQIHQLQTAWWVFPTAEHTRFQHVLGAMHLASRTIAVLYDSLVESVAPESVPSRAYVESLVRIAGLLHDVGHGPFGHFFDRNYLNDFSVNGQKLNHEVLGGIIIKEKLGDLIRAIRRNPSGTLNDDEQLDPNQVAFLIKRPDESSDRLLLAGASGQPIPRWLYFLRSLFCGLYTVDNMDFVLRDAFMSGINQRSIDIDRLLHYTRFTNRGLTIFDKGASAVIQFIYARAELFKTLYFHRTVRAIDLDMADLFAKCKPFLFVGNPVEHLDEYLRFTEFSLMAQFNSWRLSGDALKRDSFEHWDRICRRELVWREVCQHMVAFQDGEERCSVLGDESTFRIAFLKRLPESLRELPLRFDAARFVCRPDTQESSRQQNFLFDSSTGAIRPLESEELYRQSPQALRVCRVYAQNQDNAEALGRAMNSLFSPSGSRDDDTNM